VTYNLAQYLVAAITLICLVAVIGAGYIPARGSPEAVKNAAELCDWGFKAGLGFFMGMHTGRSSRLK